MLPAELIQRWRRQARAILDDINSTESQRRLAWLFLKQHGVK